MPSDRLELSGITKVFPGIKALDDVSVSVRPGEIHGLLGENGAGKSTLLNILSGVFTAEQGSIKVDGESVVINRPLDARAAGIAMIHQELQNVPELSVAQNMFLGRPIKRMGGLIVNRQLQESRATEVLATLDGSIDPRAPIHSLKVAQKQIVEIGRALLENARVIAMDEPTSSLTPSEFERLVELVHSLSSSGVSIIYVSHKMDEVFRICQRSTILRDGRVVDVVDMRDTTEQQVIASMVGRDLVHGTHQSHATETIALEVKGIGRGSAEKDVSFAVHHGEVLGISGLVGAGRTELMRLIAGADKPDMGNVEVNGSPVPVGNPRAAIAAGLGLLPEERKREGIVAGRSVASNMALPSMGMYSTMGFMRNRHLHQSAEQTMSELRLRPLSVQSPIGTFSGGNQQKAIIGRWLAASAQILLFDEPTRGIDVGAKAEIYALIERLAADGHAIVVVSSEMTELIRISDRVLVMREGSKVADLAREQISESNLLAHAIPQATPHANPQGESKSAPL